MFENHIPKAEAVRRLLKAWKPVVGKETVDIDQACGRFAAEDILAKYNIPVFRASGMDGICVNFDLFEDGVPDATGWTRGDQYERADTGDDFDDRYDTVLPIEWVRAADGPVTDADRIDLSGGIIINPQTEPRFHSGPTGAGKMPVLERGMNVRPSGSRLKKGELLLKAGMRITPFDIGAIASGGYDSVEVMARPTVAFIPTGSELVAAGSDLERGQNFDSNSHMVRAMLKMIGAKPVIYPIVKDKKADLEKALDDALSEADIVIINGGSSKGSEDFNAELLGQKGTLLYHWIQAAPGRPMAAAATDDGKLILNIAGPSMAAYYGVAWCVRELVSAWYGTPIPWGVETEVTAAEDIPSPPLSILRKVLVRRAEDGILTAEVLKGPGGPDALEANAVYFTDPDGGPIKKGDRFTVLMVR